MIPVPGSGRKPTTKWALLVLGLGAIVFYFIDINSPALFYSVLLPLLFGANILFFVFWAYKAGHLRSTVVRDVSGIVSGSGDGGGGGDAGGC